MNDICSNPAHDFNETFPAKGGRSHWWLVIWSTWGSVIALIILWLDRNPITAAVWAGAGICFGLFTSRYVEPFVLAFTDWFKRLRRDEPRTEYPLDYYIDENDSDEPESEASQLATRWAEEECSRTLIAVPTVMGGFYGVLFGGRIGALTRFEPTATLSSSQSALLGAVLFTIVLSFGLSAGCACLNISVQGVEPRFRKRQRFLILLSPLLAIPAAWHAIRSLLWKRSYIP